MEVIETALAGLYIIKPAIFGDDRGYFLETYNEKRFQENGIDYRFVQDNQSKSKKGVLRGLHFQSPPHAQGKLVSVVQGAVMDVAVDIRKSSATYGKHIAYRLDAEQKHMLFVPPGFAHGFVTLEDETIFTYKCTGVYNKESEGALLWNDPVLNIRWGIDSPIISDKDQIAGTFETFNSPFD
jgi:dTDP-4-dehydrorhamnose 3,5-epimerase